MNDEISKEWLQKSIAAKSDQLNSDDLITGPITVKITGVRRGKTVEQPIAIELDGNAEKPYLPCKGMRRVLIAAWGDDPHAWVGRRMMLYRNPEVMYGGVRVGGIEISHLSHLPSDLQIMRTVRRGVKTPLTVKKLADDKLKADPPKEQPDELSEADDHYLIECDEKITNATSVKRLLEIHGECKTAKPHLLAIVEKSCGRKRKELESPTS